MDYEQEEAELQQVFHNREGKTEKFPWFLTTFTFTVQLPLKPFICGTGC